jgi:hypothetical protein
VGLVMLFARTGPDEAVSNLSKWANKLGFHRISAWLRTRRADQLVFHWSLVAMGALILAWLGGVIYIFLSPAPVPTPGPSIALPASTLPPIPLEDNEVHGWLRPANEPTPPNGCDRMSGAIIDPDTIKILIGDNAIAKKGLGKIIALEVGDCEALSMDRTEGGIFVNADVYGGAENSPVQIRNNEIFALSGENYTPKQSRDLSTITVKDNKGREILYAHYLNPTTLQVRGIFWCLGHKPVIIRDEEPVPGFFMTGGCLMNGRAGIHVN